MNDPSAVSGAAAAAAYQRKCAQALEHLQGIVDGMVSDGRLDPREVKFLNGWLNAHPEATADWPGALLQRKVRQILADGVVSGAELSWLHESLTHLASTVLDDVRTGPTAQAALPIDDGDTIAIRGRRVCLVAPFLFGPRPACERLLESAGASLSERVTTRVDCVVVGTRLAPVWQAEPYGEDIAEALALRRLGHTIAIVSERRLLEALR